MLYIRLHHITLLRNGLFITSIIVIIASQSLLHHHITSSLGKAHPKHLLEYDFFFVDGFLESMDTAFGTASSSQFCRWWAVVLSFLTPKQSAKILIINQYHDQIAILLVLQTLERSLLLIAWLASLFSNRVQHTFGRDT